MTNLIFNASDLEQLRSKGQTEEKLLSEIETFKSDFPFTKISRSCSVNDGISVIEEENAGAFFSLHDRACSEGRVMKFVPASGAASRMFKFLQSCENESLEPEYIATKVKEDNSDYKNLEKFLANIHKFAFFNALKEVMSKNNLSLDKCLEAKDYRPVLEHLLYDIGLNYSNLPKALIKFHNYGDYTRAAIEEHLIEGVNYARSNDGLVKLHFTVSPEHLEPVKSLINSVKDEYENEYRVKFDISFSFQKPSTDTIAVDRDNNPFRDKNGRLVFRPGGHGSLIENLNELDGDIVFIKNIDNVVPDRLKEKTTVYKKIIGGYLIGLQDKIFAYLRKIADNQVDEQLCAEMLSFARNELYLVPPQSIEAASLKEKSDYLFSKLNRPVRVCGMVKNEGEPGGGPFWVEDSDRNQSLQIVETSQIDIKTEDQKQKLASASHFNPVDLVCGLKDFRGSNFNLKDYIDPNTGFISIKSKDGRELKALELPGLWNGAMAKWNTVFVEVPVITFNPVKTVNDLLRDEHQ